MCEERAKGKLGARLLRLRVAATAEQGRGGKRQKE